MSRAGEVLVCATPFGRRAAVVDGRGRVTAFFVENAGAESAVGDIWYTRISRPVPGHDGACFVDLGDGIEALLPEGGTPGETVLVQVSRDGFGRKGPRVSRDITHAGRLLVYRPNAAEDSVSRDVRDPAARGGLLQLLEGLARPRGGFTVRRLAADADEDAIRLEAAALVARSEAAIEAARGDDVPRRIQSAGGLIGRLLREAAPQGSRLCFDDREAFEAADALARAVAPSCEALLELCGDTDLFERHDTHAQWEAVLGAQVPLPSGGRLIIEETAACVAIDVDAGTAAKRGAQAKAAQEAVDAATREIVRRNLAGLIAIDLPGDAGRRGARDLASAMRRALKADRTPADVLGVSHAGVLEVTRRRVGSSLLEAMTEPDDSLPWPARRWRLSALAFDAARRARMEWAAGARALVIRADPALARMLAETDPVAAWLRADVTVESDARLPRGAFDVRAA